MKIRVDPLATGDPIEDAFAASSSRRQVLKRLGALGVVAAGGVALAPLAAGATTGAPRITHYSDPTRLPVLDIKPYLKFGYVEVLVGAAIRFRRAHVEAMNRDGVRYRVTCALWDYDPAVDATSDLDKRNGDDFLTDMHPNSGGWGSEPKPGADGRNGWLFPPRGLNSQRVGSLPFLERVPAPDLRELDTYPDSVPDLYAVLQLYRSDDGGRSWTEIKESSAKTLVKTVPYLGD